MNYVQKIISTHPQAPSGEIREFLINLIQQCFDCAQACTTCSDACLAEKNIESLRATIRATADCADVCISTGKLLSRLIAPDLDCIRSQVTSCLAVVHNCGILCNEHRHQHEHCAVCTDSCKACEKACSDYLKKLS